MVEAMACGAPVIATRRGAVPEVVAHGETGFVIDDLDTAVTAVGLIQMVDRSACRRVETCFSVERMVQGYRAVYRSLAA